MKVRLDEADVYLLRFLFPQGVYVDVYKTYMTTWNEKKLSFELDPAGVLVTSALGLCGILRSLEYMPEIKIQRVEKSGLEGQALFRFVYMTAMMNTGTANTAEDIFGWLKGLILPLPERVRYFERVDPENGVKGVLTFIQKLFDPAYMRKYGKKYQEQIMRCKGAFDKTAFKELDYDQTEGAESLFHRLLLLWR